jgi:F-type H+-transporting ATPase subunit k
MATLGTITALTFVSSGGSSAVKKTQTPPINASSPDEEKFIKYVG